MQHRLFIPAACLLTTLTSSCGTMKEVGSSMGTGFDKVANAATSPFRPGVPVVEVREEDLKELPSGHERALAFQDERQRRREAWSFHGNVDFEAPDLPEDGAAMGGGLLPSLD